MKEHRILYAGLTLTNGAKMAAHGRRCNFEIIANFIGGSTMKNTMRKMLSLALVVVMLACAIPFSAFAATDLELARAEQNRATAAYNTALQNYNDADNAVRSRTATRDAAASTAATAQKNYDDACAAETAANKEKIAALNGWVAVASAPDSPEKTAAYNRNVKADEDLAAAQALTTRRLAELNTANAALTEAQNQLDWYTDNLTEKTYALNNAKLAKDAADEAVRVAESNQNTTTKKASLRLIVSDESGNTITTINREYEPTSAFDLRTLIPSGYTFVRMKSGNTSSIVPLTEGQNNRTVIVRANSSTTTPPSTVTPPSTTAVPATVQVTVLKNDTARTQIGVYTVSISDINVTKTYDIKNLIPSGYTFISRKNGSTDTVVTLTSGLNKYTVIVAANSTSVSGGSNTSGGIWLGNNNNVVNKDPWPVYLNIYMNGNVSTIAKKVDITKGIAADGYVDLEDVKTVVKSYFNAKDSDGIQYDGLYIFDGSFGGQYTTDVGRVDGYGNINEDRKLSTVNINVMIKNAVAKGSVAADTSNPKTGDMIFLTVTALVASAGALALVYANKKRFLVK